MRAFRLVSLACLATGLWICFLWLAGCGSEPFHAAPDTVEPIPLPDLGPATPHGILIQRTVPLENPRDPDWKRLYADVYLPEAKGPFPALLMATAYKKEIEELATNARWFATQGFAVVMLDVMGTGSSEGGWESFSAREIDGIVWVIDGWIPDQPWSNGKVLMYGSSYQGIATYLTAGRHPERLRAIQPEMAPADVYRDIYFQGGLFNQQFIGVWAVGTILLSLIPGSQLFDDPQSALRALADHVAQAPEVVSWMSRTRQGPFFEERSPQNGWDRISRYPSLARGGWFDLFTRGTLLNHTYTVRAAEAWERRGVWTGPKHLVMGPWYHGGTTAALESSFQTLRKRWFDWHLKADQDPDYRRYAVLEPAWPVTLFVMGREAWRREKEWPLARAEPRVYYLSGERQAHDLNESLNNGSLVAGGDGRGDPIRGGSGPATRISYHPYQERERFAGQKSRSSVRWLMGVLSFLPWAEDERENERVTLTFSTDPLDEDLEVTGPITLRMWARSRFESPVAEPPAIWSEWAGLLGIDVSPLIPWASRPDVHWAVNLNDVFPDGRVRNLTSGWLAASHRPDPARPDWTAPGYDPLAYPEDREPAPPEDGAGYEYVIEIWPTSNVFRKGHQIRVDVAVTDFPHFLPSLVPSENEILHGPEHPSRLILPVVPAGSTEPRQWIADPEAFFAGKTPWEAP